MLTALLNLKEYINLSLTNNERYVYSIFCKYTQRLVSCLTAFYGVIFPGESEAGFSNYRLWESLGFFIAYACSTILCIESKITILLIFLLLGIAGYYTIEALEKIGLKKDQDGRVIRMDALIAKSFQSLI